MFKDMKIGNDKWLHIWVCMATAIVTSAILAMYSALLGIDTSVTAPAIAMAGFISGVAVGVGKEYGDMVNPNSRWDWHDITADLVGSLIGAVVALIAL